MELKFILLGGKLTAVMIVTRNKTDYTLSFLFMYEKKQLNPKRL